MALRLKQLEGATSSDIDIDSRTISNVSTPSTGDQAANKTYVDSVGGGSTGRLSMAGPIKQVVVETATDTIDITGLDFDVDGEYELSFGFVNDAGGSLAYSIYAGDPTIDDTAANYDSNRVVDGVSYTDSTAIFGGADAAGGLLGRIRVGKDPTNLFRAIAEINQKAGPVNQQSMVLSVNTFGSITALRFSSPTDGFGVGSYVRVYRLGGTLSTGTSIKPLDVKRAADGFDDEFESSTLDSSWTVVGGAVPQEVVLGETGSSVRRYDLTSRPGQLLTQCRSNDANYVTLRKDFTLPNDESIVVACSPGYHTSGSGDNSQVIGIALNDNDAGLTSGNYVYIAIVESDGAAAFSLETVGSGVGLISGAHTLQWSAGKFYMRMLRNSSGEYSLYVSRDGTAWHELGITSGAPTLTNFWLFQITTVVPPQAPITAWDWVRLGSADHDPWPLVDGSTVKPVAVGEWRGALLGRTGNTQTGLSAGTWHPITYDLVEEDTDGFSDIGGSNPERFTIPAGVTRVRVSGHFAATNGGGEMYGRITKNGVYSRGMPYGEKETTGTEYFYGIETYSIEVEEGDYLQVEVASTGSTCDIPPNELLWFAIEVIEPIVAITDKGTVNISSADSPYTMPNSKKTVYVTADGATTINLPPLANNNMMEVEVKIISGSSTVTIDGNSSEEIEGATTYDFSGVGESRTFKAKSINGDLGWYMVARASIDPASLVLFTCTSTEAVGNPVYISASDTVAQADGNDTAKLEVIGWIYYKPTTTTCLVAFGPGPVTGSGLTAGSKVFLSDTAGAVSSSEGTYIVELGIAKTTTSWIFTGAKVIA